MRPVGIRGVGLQCALGADAETCVSSLLTGGKPAIQVTLEDLTEPATLTYRRIEDGAVLFDPQRFERLLPEVVRAALAEAGLTATECRDLPVFLGSSCFSIALSEAGYAMALAQDPAAAISMPSAGYGYLADLVRSAAGSEAASFTYNTACTASANALLGAVRAMHIGRYRHALVVGAELANRTTMSGFSGLQLLADRVRPFDAARSGIVLGEGISAVLLSAEPREGELLLRGGASNCDTFSVTTANPDGASVAAALRQALAVAGIEAKDVCGIRAHGTATPSGDTAEALGLRRVFDAVPALSVLKPYLGHTLGACGVNELVLYAGALRRGVLPAAVEPFTPDPELGVGPLARTATAPAGHYLLNHFGFGGNNTVLILERP
ncbi:MAG TPA: beta-ketoacyl synthase N-terminal-like domain-containing protein [Gammaproteobacteria bacterium]|jgi:3-oxoacyl-[acyl-carrier-protein] synthase-1